jgi:hypothetical protein
MWVRSQDESNFLLYAFDIFTDEHPAQATEAIRKRRRIDLNIEADLGI